MTFNLQQYYLISVFCSQQCNFDQLWLYFTVLFYFTVLYFMDNTVFSDNQRWVFIQNQDTWFKSYIFLYLFSKNFKLLSILIFTAWYLRKLFPPQTNTIKKAIATFYLTMLFFFSLNIINEPNLYIFFCYIIIKKKYCNILSHNSYIFLQNRMIWSQKMWLFEKYKFWVYVSVFSAWINKM